jgi:hypothetical protein
MEDSLQRTNRLIALAKEQLSAEAPPPNPALASDSDPADISLGLEELELTASRLEGKIKSSMLKLLGKDSATAAAVKRAINGKFLGLRMKGRALLVRIRLKVQQSLLAASPYRRRISRAKKGGPPPLPCPFQADRAPNRLWQMLRFENIRRTALLVVPLAFDSWPLDITRYAICCENTPSGGAI